MLSFYSNLINLLLLQLYILHTYIEYIFVAFQINSKTIMKLGCPVCIGLAFLRWLFDLVAEHAFRLYRFVFSSPQDQASKTVTLGNPPPFPAGEVLSPSVVEDRKDNDNGDYDDEVGEDNDKGEDTMMSVVPEKKAPKKTVSINENVEEINSGKRLKRRNKSKQKLLSSMEEEEEVEPKRLKSILKVSSNINDQFK